MTTPFSQLVQSIHHLFIIDLSQTKASSHTSFVSRVNDSIEALKKSQQTDAERSHRLTIMKIHGRQITCHAHDMAVSEAGHFFHSPIEGHSSTAVLDGIGASIGTWKALLGSSSPNKKHSVTIFSNMQDHGSLKYRTCTIKSIISSLKNAGWSFTLVGTTTLLPQIASRFEIPFYCICKAQGAKRERTFLISQLKRQWCRQQLTINERIKGAAA